MQKKEYFYKCIHVFIKTFEFNPKTKINLFMEMS